MENNNKNNNARVIALKDLWEIFLRCVWFMLAAAILVGGLYLLFDKLTFKPQYASTARVYLVNEAKENASSAESINSYTLGVKLVYDCTYMLKSNSVVNQTREELGLEEISYSTLRNNISVNNPEDTRFLEVTVRADTPEDAKAIVDKLCNVGTEKINKTMGYQQVTSFEDGLISTTPCNRTSTLMYIAVALAAAVAIYVLFLLMFLLDDSLRTEEDIERYLGLSVLGDIPDADASKRKKYGYHSWYGYGSGARYGYGYGCGRRNNPNADNGNRTEG